MVFVMIKQETVHVLRTMLVLVVKSIIYHVVILSVVIEDYAIPLLVSVYVELDLLEMIAPVELVLETALILMEPVILQLEIALVQAMLLVQIVL